VIVQGDVLPNSSGDHRAAGSRTHHAVSWRVKMKLPVTALLFLVLWPAILCAQKSPIFGDWQEPAGSILRIETCGTGICLRIIKLAASAPSKTDIHNPQPVLRGRSLCGLEIGRGFSLVDATHATGGSLYDPKSGNTYHGTMTVKGDRLSLRGYIGFSIFGRTEVWQRNAANVRPCS
jgi:uncharacterized protein (DUF2147 family)